jgi:hypothetical protein
MQTGELPPDVVLFLRDHIESYEQLEMLLLLRAQGGSAWSEEALGARLGISAWLTSEALAELLSAGFVDARMDSGGQKQHTYRPQSESVEATIDGLQRAYRERPMLIIEVMNANAIERVRTAALRTFADAFILRKDKNRG